MSFIIYEIKLLKPAQHGLKNKFISTLFEFNKYYGKIVKQFDILTIFKF